MKKILLLLLIIHPFLANSQDNSIDWNGNYILQLSDFQSPASQIGDATMYSLNSACGFNFSFYMSNAEFMFTKNFNSKVNCAFVKNSSVLVAPDTSMALQLLNFARFDFDLSELYARKFRQKLYENKKAFSSIEFCKPAYDTVQNEFIQRHTAAAKETDLGRDSTKLIVLHSQVLNEIEQLPDFCKACKPVKKKP